MKKIFLIAFAFAVIMLTSCTENYSNGERIGYITQFSETGLIWKSWEGHLNVTQTGMNSSVPFDFSLDNDTDNPDLVEAFKEAAEHGYKVKLTYHQTFGFNWFSNRGETNHFINGIEILDKTNLSTNVTDTLIYKQ